MGLLLTASLVWIAHQTPSIQAPAGFKRIDLNYVPFELESWLKVSQVRGKLSIQTYEQYNAQEQSEWRQVKPSDVLEVKVGDRLSKIQLGKGSRVIEGEMFPIDMGEWGGGIAFISRGTKKATPINWRNTQAVEQFSTGVYAVQALSHLGFWYSDLVKLTRMRNVWQAKVVTNLHVIPKGISRIDNHFVIFADDYVTTLNLDGTQKELHRLEMLGSRCYNMTILSNGQIWLGADFGVVCLTPRKDHTYDEYHFVPINAKRKSNT